METNDRVEAWRQYFLSEITSYEDGYYHDRSDIEKHAYELAQHVVKAITTHEREVREDERTRIKDYLWSKANHGKTTDGEIYETIVHWCYVKTALKLPEAKQ